jgi:hypothetical protein
MQDRHIALRREALVAKGEETLVARVEALKVLRAWMLRAFVGLFPPPYPRRQSSFFQGGAFIYYVFLRPEINRLCSYTELTSHPAVEHLKTNYRIRPCEIHRSRSDHAGVGCEASSPLPMKRT